MDLHKSQEGVWTEVGGPDPSIPCGNATEEILH